MRSLLWGTRQAKEGVLREKRREVEERKEVEKRREEERKERKEEMVRRKQMAFFGQKTPPSQTR